MSLCVLNSKCNQSLRGTSVCHPLYSSPNLYPASSIFPPFPPPVSSECCKHTHTTKPTMTHKNQHSISPAHPLPFFISLSRTPGFPFISCLSHLWQLHRLPVCCAPPSSSIFPLYCGGTAIAKMEIRAGTIDGSFAWQQRQRCSIISEDNNNSSGSRNWMRCAQGNATWWQGLRDQNTCESKRGCEGTRSDLLGRWWKGSEK